MESLKYLQKRSVWIFVRLKLFPSMNFEKEQNTTNNLGENSAENKKIRLRHKDREMGVWIPKYHSVTEKSKGIHVFFMNADIFPSFLFCFVLSIPYSFFWQSIHIQKVNDITNLLVNFNIPCQILWGNMPKGQEPLIKPTKQLKIKYLL